MLNFSVTKRFICIYAICIPISILLAVLAAKFAMLFFLSYNVVLFGLLIADYLISPSKEHFSLTRPTEIKLYFKTSNLVKLDLTSAFARVVRVEAKLDLTRFFAFESDKVVIKLAPFTETSVVYNVVAEKRGSFMSSVVYLKVYGVLGLCERFFYIESPMEIKVYPNLRDLSKYRLIVNRKLSDFGQVRLPLRGFGSEFESLREYSVGDDYKKINWLATARENKLIVNQFEADKNNPVFILLETGRALSYEVNGYKKLDYAVNSALILADIINQKGDDSGLLVFNTKVDSITMPKKGNEHRNRLMETLFHVSHSRDTSNYALAFNELNARMSRRSIAFIFTDFETIEEAKDLLSTIPILAKRHLPILVLMKNESAEKLALEPFDINQAYLRAAAIDYLTKRRAIIKLLNKRGVICVESTAEEFAMTAVNKYLAIKDRH